MVSGSPWRRAAWRTRANAVGCLPQEYVFREKTRHPPNFFTFRGIGREGCGTV
jgi:hypothetical protein